MDKTVRFIDLFAGMGAYALALNRHLKKQDTIQNVS